MFCRNCGKELTGAPEICLNCGAKPMAGTSFCYACGAATTPLTEICMKCGARMGKANRAEIARKIPKISKGPAIEDGRTEALAAKEPKAGFFKTIGKKENRKWLILSLVGVVLAITAVSLVSHSINANRPKPEIISHNLRTDVTKTGEGLLDYDYVYVIDATVMNKGKAGTVTVWAKVEQDSNVWQQSQTVFLNHVEQKQVQFTFNEPEFLKEFLEGYLGTWEGYKYKVWAEVP